MQRGYVGMTLKPVVGAEIFSSTGMTGTGVIA